MMVVIAIVGLTAGAIGFVAGGAHERWSRTRWIRSLPPRDIADLMMEEF